MDKKGIEIVVKDALYIKKRGLVSVVGSKSEEALHIGDVLTDGVERYTVAAIPLISRRDYADINDTCFAIAAGDFDPSALVGKILSDVT